MKHKELKVGILALVCGVALYFGFNFLKGEDFFSSTNKYITYFQNVNGLTISNPVIVDGFAVGRVKNMDLEIKEGKRRVKVTIDVRDDIPVGDSTTAVLTADGLLGGQAIVLEIGNNSQLFQTGQELPGRLEKSITEELEERIQPVINTLDTTLHRMNNLITREDKSIIRSSLLHIEKTTIITEKMAAENRKTFNEVGVQLKDIMSHFAETERKIAPLLDKMGTFTDSLNTMKMATALRDVQEMIASMNDIILKINSKDGTIGMMMNDKTLYNNLNKTFTSLDSLVNHMNEHPDHYMAPLGKSKEQIEKEKRKEAKKSKK